MALIACKECGAEVSSEAASCPKCGVRLQPKSNLWKWILGVPVGLFAAVLIFGATRPNFEEKSRDRRAYEQCIANLGSADRARNGTGNFIAGACEMMRQEFVKKYNVEP